MDEWVDGRKEGNSLDFGAELCGMLRSREEPGITQGKQLS